MEKYEKRKRFIINAVFYSMIGFVIFVAGRYLLPVMIPFIVAFLIAGLIQIPVKKIGGTSRKRQKIAAAFFCILCYSVFFLMVVVLGMKLVQGVGGIVANAPSIYNERVAPVLGEIANRLELAAASVDTGLSQAIDKIFSDFSQNIGRYITNLSMPAVRLLSGRATRIPGFIVKLVVTVVATFFMAMDFGSILSFF